MKKAALALKNFCEFIGMAEYAVIKLFSLGMVFWLLWIIFHQHLR